MHTGGISENPNIGILKKKIYLTFLKKIAFGSHVMNWSLCHFSTSCTNFEMSFFIKYNFYTNLNES